MDKHLCIRLETINENAKTKGGETAKKGGGGQGIQFLCVQLPDCTLCRYGTQINGPCVPCPNLPPSQFSSLILLKSNGSLTS